MNVLSLFDGMACGLVALKRAGIKVDNYFASEVDKYPIQIAKKNHPEIEHIGDVNHWPMWRLPEIDLMIGGSPCQGFSFAGKQLNFKDPRSKLFFQYINCRDAFGPKWSLLENVRMKKESMQVITDQLGFGPVKINSSLVSAQNRVREYWCNWNIDQPDDKGILLKDIIDCSDDWKKEISKQSKCVMVGLKDGNGSHEIQRRIYSPVGKSPTLMAISSGGAIPPIVFIGGIEKGRRLHDGKSLSRNFREGSRIYSIEGKAAALTAKTKGNQGGYTGLYGISKTDYRKLTPIECERLQTLPDNYTEGVSNTQRYKMIGNGWTVDVISHILKSINN